MEENNLNKKAAEDWAMQELRRKSDPDIRHRNLVIVFVELVVSDEKFDVQTSP